MSTFRSASTKRAQVKRAHERGHYDRSTINQILDACPLCHVAYVLDGAPIVTPTLQWREGDRVYWHGSSASRMLRTAADQEVCLAVTMLDGLVLARSAFDHSANYRSVMLFGRTEIIVDPDEKAAHLQVFVESLFPGRWNALRPMTDQELKATTLLSLTIDEASAKIRSGPPQDNEADYQLPIWAGVIPLEMRPLTAVPDPRNREDVLQPEHVSLFQWDGHQLSSA